MRILIVDSHGVYRKGLRGTIEAAMPEAQVLEADSVEAARGDLEPDGVVDLVLAELTPSSAMSLWAVHARYPKTRFAAMAPLSARKDIVRSLAAGWYGFISKSQSDSEILDAIRVILSDRIYVPPLLTRIEHSYDHGWEAESPSVAKDQRRFERLTRRQREVLPLLARGMSNKEIARALKIAEGTTKIHASGLFRALGVRNRTEAVAVAQSLFAVDHDNRRPDWD